MLTRRSMFILYSITGIIILFLILPTFVIIPISFSSGSYLKFPPDGFSLRWYVNYFTNENWLSATWISFEVALATSIFSSLLGIPLSIALQRYKFPGRSLLYGLVVSPLVVPVIIIAIAIYIFYSKVQLIGSIPALIVAHTLVALPIVVIIVTASLKNYDTNLDHAAMNLGAGPFITFREITLPLISPAILSSAIFAFIMSFDELLITMFICGNSTTLPKRMWDSVRHEIDPTLASISTLLIALSILLLFIIQHLRKRWQT